MASKQYMSRYSCKIAPSIPSEFVFNLALEAVKHNNTVRQFKRNFGISYNQAKYAMTKAKETLTK